MILESYISLKRNLISEEEYEEIKTGIDAIFERIVFEEKDLQPILELLVHDKKNEYGTIQFALLDGIGNIKTGQIINNELIIDSFLEYNS
ncbi:3-dehydroquinate synthase [compost metagenome]